ncbi:16S rRNA (guanine(966)-N(2))-methyltransferase RsmD [Coriobacteriia bacterium Es71-Z0120]|uniref:16S rRNA (guanine(966)-N(2))-methyltransferase RsmD n=1 Tax=Parvivirga hydrogeniphila TaxID=2939460 RepID=UPI002260817C|nr:16S rRNA (guanine(966)-N(2))-methyltransferase RsmD [Parvivirga hydrogeniphila]MCL4079552.1 16S rRNA (guanine(966)-N(2))-methyltransferase RsmD [Parvivirga hydrogeniphila]
MRVVGGQLRGRRIAAPRGRDTRPTSDRVREALFSILEARYGGVDGAVVLDLFAGTGALGIEALSRGAAHATFVDSDERAVALIRQNLASLGLSDRTTVLRADALRSLPARLAARPFSLLLADPPYRIEPREVVQAVLALGARGRLVTGAVVAYELSTANEVEWPRGFDETVEKAYGSTRLSIARWKGSVDE